MNFRIIITSASVLAFTAAAWPAEDQALQLQSQLKQLQADFDQTRRQQQQQIDELTRKLATLTGAPTPAAPPAPAKTDDQQKLEQELAAAIEPAARPPSQMPAPPPVAPGAHAGSSYMNLSFGSLLAAGWSTATDPSAQLELGDHDPIKRGFALRNAEISVDGAIDPYFKGFANIVLKLDKNNETEIELEESYLQSTALPDNLQLKAGQYFASFGRQNPQHPHTWAFVISR